MSRGSYKNPQSPDKNLAGGVWGVRGGLRGVQRFPSAHLQSALVQSAFYWEINSSVIAYAQANTQSPTTRLLLTPLSTLNTHIV